MYFTLSLWVCVCVCVCVCKALTLKNMEKVNLCETFLDALYIFSLAATEEEVYSRGIVCFFGLRFCSSLFAKE